MKWFLRSLAISLVLLSFFSAPHAQTPDFNVNSYKQFLSENQNLTTEKLLGMHPTGLFMGNLRLNHLSGLYADSIGIKFNLTSGEKSLLDKNGFMVTERVHFNTFQIAFREIYNRDLPVMITSDAVLHAFHMSYDKILMDVENDVLIPELKSFLKSLHENLPALKSAYSADAGMTTSLKDVDIYLTVARTLLEGQTAPVFAENSSEITAILQFITSEQPASVNLFSSTGKLIDFSQFKTRGHYTKSPALTSYFKAMIWLGRTEMYLSAPRALEPAPKPEDIQRQTIDAALILEAVQASGTMPQYEKINGIIEFFTGEQDNVTLVNLKSLTQSLNAIKAGELLDISKLKTFQDSLKNQSYAFQRILSQIICTGFDSPDSIVPASAFMLFGQRFVIDSYVTAQTVFDRIYFNNERMKRMLPSTLDVMYALGNDAAIQLLKPELDKYHYGTNLAALRYLVDSYGEDFWNLSLYNGWLNSIRKLNPKKDRSNLPSFMQTAAWWQQKLNTQLASWAQLRHDNLLYAKQSYSGGAGCSFPYGYVEPVPELYLELKKLSEKAKNYFSSFNFSDSYTKSVLNSYFSNAITIYTKLASISEKELGKTPLSDEDMTFIRSLVSTGGVCGMDFHPGWYMQLFYQGDALANDPEYVVADVHTAPTDEAGNPTGWVLHAGTGPVNLGVFSVESPSGERITYAGPMLSYYEYLTTGFQRLSDEEWLSKMNMIYMSNPPALLRPEFVNLYLTDYLGKERPEGLSLLTSVPDRPDDQLPQTMTLAQNYPNPFNSTTVINFVIPNKMANRQVTLIVYNALGVEVKKLIDNTLPAGNYFMRWNGTDNFNQSVSSGVYFYNLVIDSEGLKEKVSGKMMLLK
ncbi:MAG TPA: DUF3160 domain-containing protein [Ignavibacteriales bacterium]|nr:DUF3160 domain-containing protein [Ignavibacteriales bacterium]